MPGSSVYLSALSLFTAGTSWIFPLRSWWGSVWRRRTGSQRSSGSMISVPRPSAGLWWPFLLCSSRNSVLFKVSGDVMIMSAIMYLVPGIPLPLRPGIPLTETMPPDLPGCWNVSLWLWPWLWAWALEWSASGHYGEERYDDTSDTQRFQRCAGIFTMIPEIPKKNICFMRPPRVRWAGGPT